MYAATKLCIRHFSTLSEFFNSNVGVKQGEPLSPFFFIMYINDVFEYINSGNDLDVEQLAIFMLLFADDMVIMSKDPLELETMLNRLYDYCVEWKMNVNINKTKTVIFCRRKGNNNIVFNFGPDNIDIVDSYVYLGVNLYYYGKPKCTLDSIANQATRAVFGLRKAYKYDIMDIETTFSYYCSPSLTIWMWNMGIWKFKGCRKIQVRFYKNILGLTKSTPNSAVFGELGAFPIKI